LVGDGSGIGLRLSGDGSDTVMFSMTVLTTAFCSYLAGAFPAR